MKIYSQLEVASFENLSADPALLPIGRIWHNTTTDRPKINLTAGIRRLMFLEDSLIIGTSGTAANNLKLHRSANGVMQLVAADDATSEASPATSLRQFGFNLENYTNAGKPAAGNAGRLIWLTDQKTILVDDGVIWKISGGGAGGSGVVWNNGVNPPFPDVDLALNPVRKYLASDTQNLLAAIKVPNTYGGGQQVKLVISAAAGDSVGNYLIRSVATLIRQGVDVITSVANQRTSTNAAIAAADQVYKKIELDLTDASGLINGVVVSANDIILVSLIRGVDTSTADVSVLDKNTELVIG
jgi:hypothetical protein